MATQQATAMTPDMAISQVKALSNPVKTLAAVLVALYLLGLIPSVNEALNVSVYKVPPPSVHLWRLITGAYVEPSIVSLLFNLGALVIAATMLETQWTPLKFIEFIGVVNVAAVTATTCTYIFIFAITGDMGYLFTDFSGFMGAVLGFTVAHKQAYPQRSLQLPMIKLESKDGPLLVLLLLFSLYLLGLTSLAPALLGLYGFLAGWTYLRHFQTRDGLRGDPSEAFTFEDFFPTPAQPVVKAVGDRVYRAFALMQLCPKKARSFDLSQPSNFHLAMPDLRSTEASRRQQLALRDLDQRLQKVVVKQAPAMRQADKSSSDTTAQDPVTAAAAAAAAAAPQADSNSDS